MITAARRVVFPPPAVWALALVLTVSGGSTLLAAAMPMSNHAPVTLALVSGLISVAAAALLWLLGARTPAWLMHATLAGTTALASLMVAACVTEGGLVLASFAYRAVSMHAAYFFSRRVAAAHAALITVAYGVALAGNDVGNRPILWLVTTATVWAVTLAIGALNARLRAQAETDALTGTLNRQGLHAAAGRLFALAQRTGDPLTVAIVDLDEFKSVNDSRGHAAGDKLLASAARAWQGALRKSDVLARHGGDEFVLLLPGTSAGEAQALLARLREDSPVAFTHGLSVSHAGDTLESCLLRADAELYSRKASRPEDASATGAGVALTA